MDPQPQANKGFWRSPTGVSAIAGLVAAIVSAGAFAVDLFSDDGASPTSPLAAPGGTPQPPAPDGELPPLDRVAFEDSMADRAVGWQLMAGPDCSANFAAAGFQIAVDATDFAHCGISTAFDPELISLGDVRVEVDAEWVSKPTELHDSGYGAVGLRCYGRGSIRDGSYYMALISDLGWWRIDRWERAAGGELAHSVLGEGVYVAAAGWGIGETVRLALDCRRSGSEVILTLWYGDRSVAVARDADPFPAGDVGPVAMQFLGAIRVEFRDLRVLTPSA